MIVPTPATAALRADKTALRKLISSTLSAALAATAPQLRAEGAAAAAHARALPCYAAARSVAVYVSVEKLGEVDTYPLLRDLFERADPPRVYVPLVTGKEAADMRMVRVESFEEILAFPKSKWGIPEPPVALLETREDASKGDVPLDLVVVPGAAFDSGCRRCGRGKGYYDCFLEGAAAAAARAGRAPPALVGLAYAAQVVDRVPVDARDYVLDFVAHPGGVFRKGC